MALLANMLVLTKHSQQNMFNTSKRCVLASYQTSPSKHDSAIEREEHYTSTLAEIEDRYLMLPGLLHGWPHDDQGVVRKHNINAANAACLL